jgi:hypothetical protein
VGDHYQQPYLYSCHNGEENDQMMGNQQKT